MLIRFEDLLEKVRAYSPDADVELLRRMAALGDLEIPVRESGAVVTRGALGSALGDEVQLRQLFVNLVGNALKFRREGRPPRVGIAGEGVPARNGDVPRVRIRVEDGKHFYELDYTLPERAEAGTNDPASSS